MLEFMFETIGKVTKGIVDTTTSSINYVANKDCKWNF